MPEQLATFALLVFAGIGTLSYLLELYQTVFKYPDTIHWLAPLTILLEDVPQILLTVFLSKPFEEANALEPLAAFNIATSVYSALIKVTGEVCVNYCYCCKFIPPVNEDSDVELGRSFVSEG